MKLTPKDRHRSINHARPLFAAGLIASSLVYSTAPVLSAPISSIDNQVTATYEDPLNPPKTTDINDPRRINTVSNIIKIIINEVAGLNVVQKGIANDKDVSISTIKSGDTVYFRFDLTNSGNEGTKIFVPNKAGLTGAGTMQRLQYFDNLSNGWKDIADGGLTSGNIPRDNILKVRVPVKVNDGASGKLGVSLGKTLTKLDDQNIEIVNADLTALKLTDRVFTIDNDDSIDGEIVGAPANGTREAMATQTSPITVDTLVNGPESSPDAVGAGNDNNQDFTNKSKISDPLEPTTIGFNNTVKNQTGDVLNIEIIPTVKADEALPEGTEVTLRDPKNTIPDVVFTVKGGKFVANNATQTFVIPQLASQDIFNYITGIKLPKGIDPLKGYAVELVAFVDRNDNNLADDMLTNKTTDRVYTGFVTVMKESRVLDVDNKTVISNFSADTKSKLAKPSQYIEYRLTFKNISPIVPNGSGSKGLSAKNFTIIEDGYASPNNWAGLTENDPNSTDVSLPGTMTFSVSDKATTTADRKVTKYTYSTSILAPQVTGTFTFRRQVSK